MQELKYPPLPEADGTAEVDKEPCQGGGYEYSEVPAWSEPLVKAYANAALAQQAARHAEELDAYALTVSNLRAQRVPDALENVAGEGAYQWHYASGWNNCREAMLSAAPAPEPERKPMPDEKIYELQELIQLSLIDGYSIHGQFRFARAVEAFHNIKEQS